MGRKSKNKRQLASAVAVCDDEEDALMTRSEGLQQVPSKGKRRRKKKTKQKVCDFLEDLDPGMTDLYELLHGPKQAKFLNKRVWHSWLTAGVEWISKSEHHDMLIESNDNESFSLYERIELQTEIDTFTRQLLQIKQRLWPVATDAAKVVSNLVNAHAVFEEARRMSNPFECLGEGKDRGLNRMFLNRSAIKLANMNALLGFRLTSSHTQCHEHEHFKFVDLCGAPGGFSEYILSRCFREGIPSHGWGLSLLGTNDDGQGCQWKLEHMMTRDGGSGMQYRASVGADGTGDIYQWENVDHFQQEILTDSTNMAMSDDKVELVVADGGCDIQRNNENQENSMLRLVVCEVATALSCLRRGGNFVLKYFGCTHISTKAVFDMLLQSFEKLTIIKPILSRPASAERYVICLNYCPSEDCNLDLKEWRDEVINQNIESKSNDSLERYVMTKDRDILKLNIRACWAILSHMETRRDAALLQKENSLVAKAITQSIIDVHKYRQVWNITKSRIAKSVHIC